MSSHHSSSQELEIDNHSTEHSNVNTSITSHHHEYLHYGDFISLFTESSGGSIGFLSVDGININCNNIQGFVSLSKLNNFNNFIKLMMYSLLIIGCQH